MRFFEYYAQRMAQAVEEAAANLKPARIGAAVGSLDKPHATPSGRRSPTTARPPATRTPTPTTT